jgi:ADP-heptose:LPS heptosyltransferase
VIDSRLGVPLPERVAVVRALRGLGDFLCVVPALRALRAALPRAEITLVGLPSAAPLQQRFRRYLDDFLEFPGFPRIPEVKPDTGRLQQFLAATDGRFDLVLQMHGSGSNSNAFTALLGARLNAGHYLPSLWCPDRLLFMPYPAHLHEIHRWLALTEFLGIPSQGDALEFPLQPDDARHLSTAWRERDGTRYVCLHPGACEAERRWPVERFAAAGDALAAQGLTVVLTGSGSERELTAAVHRAMLHPAVDLAGATDIGTLTALLAGAQLLICNDTGVSHLAAALAVPSVVIFSASDPGRWAPLDRGRHRVVGEILPERAKACRHSPEVKGHRCLRDACSSLVVAPADDWSPASVDEVLGEAEELLAAAPYH